MYTNRSLVETFESVGTSSRCAALQSHLIHYGVRADFPHRVLGISYAHFVIVFWSIMKIEFGAIS